MSLNAEGILVLIYILGIFRFNIHPSHLGAILICNQQAQTLTETNALEGLTLKLNTCHKLEKVQTGLFDLDIIKTIRYESLSYFLISGSK